MGTPQADRDARPGLWCRSKTPVMASKIYQEAFSRCIQRVHLTPTFQLEGEGPRRVRHGVLYKSLCFSTQFYIRCRKHPFNGVHGSPHSWH